MTVEDADRQEDYVLVFNCLSCGTLLSCDSGAFGSGATCPNCGAVYDYMRDGVIIRYGRGRPPTQWKSAGFSPSEAQK